MFKLPVPAVAVGHSHCVASNVTRLSQDTARQGAHRVAEGKVLAVFGIALAFLMMIFQTNSIAQAEDAPPTVIRLPDHTIRDAQGNIASELRNVRLTFVEIDPVSLYRFKYLVEWDITNATHNVTSIGVDGPDSRIYLRIHREVGDDQIAILLAGRSDCSTRHMTGNYGFTSLADTAARISLQDNGVVGPQAPC